MTTKQTIKDHLGNEFESIIDLCNHWNISRRTFYRHLQNGENVQSIIEYLTSPSKRKRCKKVKDHLGQEYESITALCKTYNISIELYRDRLKLGWSLKDVLTTPISTKYKIKSIDHLGNEFDSITDMCAFYNIPTHTFKRRLKYGYSIERALTKPIDERYGPKKVTDHLGNEFDSITDMCTFYNIPTHTFKRRLKYGYSIEQALTYGPKKVIDPFGNEFKTISDMLNNYHTKESTYYTYKRKKYSEIEALCIIPIIRQDIHNQRVTDDLTVQKHISENYYLCTFHNYEIIMHRDTIITYATNYYKEIYKTKPINTEV